MTPQRVVEVRRWHLVLALVAVVGSYVAMGILLDRESTARSQANLELIEEQKDIRSELVRGFKRADVLNCRKIERLFAHEREDARKQYRDLDQTLRLLDIEKTPEIVALARENRDEALARFAPIRGGCGQLP